MKHGRRSISLTLGLAFLAPLLVFHAGCKNMTDQEIKAAMEIELLDTKWVAKEYKVWPNAKLTLVPTVSFRVKNLSSNPLTYVNFNGIFKNKDDVENLGDQFLAAIRNKPVLPGAWSDPITLKSNLGVEGKRLADFQNNPQWKTYFVRVFAQSKGSRHVLLAEWPVSRKIDFKEDQPAHQGTNQKQEPVKK
jgi:hypothetical protein